MKSTKKTKCTLVNYDFFKTHFTYLTENAVVSAKRF